MAEPELVNVFRADTGTVLSLFTASTSCADALDYLTTKYGAGFLEWTSEGRVIPVTKSSFPTLPLTGKLEWHGRPGVGEVTLTRHLASQAAEMQVAVQQAVEQATKHLKEEIKQKLEGNFDSCTPFTCWDDDASSSVAQATKVPDSAP
ncbi:hypothetical protein QJQ45_018736 [Haematococcus lacustris]|nr:hypothetical protein QJQ45_018736 [Haematococcus lacustris]